MSEKDPLADLQEVPSNWVKWGKVGDFIRGTLVSKRVSDGYNPGKKQTVYELKTTIGRFYQTESDETPTEVKEGEFWQVGSKDWTNDELETSIGKQMRNVKLGQIVAFQFTGTTPSATKGFQDAKVIKVLVGGHDSEWMGQTSADIEVISADEVPFE